MSTSKPIVNFVGKAVFFDSVITDKQKEQYNCDSNNITQAVVYSLDHPILGKDRVTTSIIKYKFDDGSFETLNTIYKPIKA
jgi:hypothetical protein